MNRDRITTKNITWVPARAAVVVVVVIFFQYNESIDIIDELVLNRNSMNHRLMMIL